MRNALKRCQLPSTMRNVRQPSRQLNRRKRRHSKHTSRSLQKILVHQGLKPSRPGCGPMVNCWVFILERSDARADFIVVCTFFNLILFAEIPAMSIGSASLFTSLEANAQLGDLTCHCTRQTSCLRYQRTEGERHEFPSKNRKAERSERTKARRCR